MEEGIFFAEFRMFVLESYYITEQKYWGGGL